MTLSNRSFTFAPIGHVRSSFADKASAPRQPNVDAPEDENGDRGDGAEGTIVLLQGHGYEDALSDVRGWSHLWILFVFDRNVDDDGRARWRPKVLPPREDGVRRGVFSTRSPHRPNPIGMSVVRLVEVDQAALTLRVRGVDMIDGTPVLDIKPYVPYADVRHGNSGNEPRDGGGTSVGWLAPKDPRPSYLVEWSEGARSEAAFLASHGVHLVERVDRALALGPQPHAYRRIRETPFGKVLAVQEWRVRFDVQPDGRTLRVVSLGSGYREKEIQKREDLALHRLFVGTFGSR